ncbi:MAG: hypothetical protein PF569_06340 [Candidatus Woesearchaeota archaeon]|jgi:hypothetical protein|nr:hypothetical protein [Candidatus Woesearchaeota archaeon]
MEPLYILALEKKLKNIQTMDLETLNWLYLKQEIEKIKFEIVCTKIPKISNKLLSEYSPIKADFVKEEKINSIHGLRHMTRVQVYVLIVCKLLNYNVYVKELLIVAGIHDIKRLNDKEDATHGYRAAEWFLKNNNHSSLDINLICNLTKSHDIEYSKISKLFLNKYEIEMNIFKVADALDRFRLPKEKWWPNKKYLLLNLDYNLLFDFAKFFIYNTEKTALDNKDASGGIINFCNKYNIFENE